MKTLLSEPTLRDGVQRMAAEINATYAGRPLTIIGVMTGSIILLADLVRLLSMPLRVGVVQASSYRESTSPGPLVINAELMPSIARRDVLVVDDIFDTGRTMVGLISRMNELGPHSVKTAVLLVKRACQEVDLQPDFVGFEIPDEFVVGYGLDYRDEYRNLPFVAALEDAEIKRPGE